MNKSSFKQFLNIITFIVLFQSYTLAEYLKIPIRPSINDIKTSDILNPETGEVLSVLDLQQKISQQNKKDIDLISSASPQDNNLWSSKNNYNFINFEKTENLSVDYIRLVPTDNLSFAFEVNSNGNAQRLYFVRKYRNVMLNATLLQAMGYKVPKINYLPQVKIKYSSKQQLEEMLTRMKYNFAYGSERFIVNQDDSSITLREGLLYEPFDNYMDMTRGVLSPGVSQYKRSLEVLSLLFYITDINENLSSEEWSSLLRVNDNVYLPNSNLNYYNTNVYDAIWFLKRLTAKFHEDPYLLDKLAEQSHYPKEYQSLVKEILKARINSLYVAFDQKSIFPDINLSITQEPYIKDGILNEEYCQKNVLPHTVSVLCGEHSEIDFPNKSQLYTLAKNYFWSAMRQNLVNKINEKNPINVGADKQINDQLNERFQKEWDDFYATGGDYVPARTKIKPITYGSFNIVNSSNLIVGSYAGFKNLVQRVDTSGFMLSINNIRGLNAFKSPTHYLYLPKKMLDLSASYQHFLTRVRPVDIDMVTGKILPFPDDDSTLVEKWKESIFPLNGEIDFQKSFADFKNKFKVGESLIAYDTISSAEDVSMFNTLPSAVYLFGKIFASQKLLNRIHVHRISDTQIQIYKDSSKSLSDWGVAGYANYYMPLMSFSYNKVKPEDVSTTVYVVDLDPSKAKEIITALKHVFNELNLEQIKTIAKKFEIKHDLTQKTTEFNVLNKNWTNLNTSDSIKIESQGVSKNLYYKSVSDRTGSNLFKIGFDFIAAFFRKKEIEIDLAVPANLQSADGPLANSSNKTITYEHDLNADGEIFDQSISIKYNQKAPKLLKSEIVERMKDINKKYDMVLYDVARFNNIKHMIMFDLMVNLRIQKKGIETLMNMDQSNLLQYFVDYQKYISCFELDDNCLEQKKSFLSYLNYQVKTAFKKFKKKANSHDLDERASSMIDLVALMDSFLNTRDLINLVGGIQNVRLESNLGGFRYGDVTAFKNPMMSSNIYGSPSVYNNGSTDRYIKTLDGVSDYYNFLSSEFLAQWLIKE